MKPLRLAAIAASGVLASGCFMSEQPKFPPSSAVAVFGSGGQYGVYEQSGGKFQRQGAMSVKRQPDGSYLFEADKKPVTISFHDVGNGITVGQARPEEKKRSYGYVMLTRKDKEFFFHTPQCDEQKPELLKTHGVTIVDKYSCSIDSVQDPTKLFAALSVREPSHKFIPE